MYFTKKFSAPVTVILTHNVPVLMHLSSVDGQQPPEPLIIPNSPHVISTNDVSIQQQQIIVGRQNSSQFSASTSTPTSKFFLDPCFHKRILLDLYDTKSL
jgi:hypothetical protein